MIGIVVRCYERISQVTSTTGIRIRKKFEIIVEKNAGFCKLKEINLMLQDRMLVCPHTLKLSPGQMKSFKFAPIRTCSVEPSFSAYKRILSDRRCKLTPEHLELLLVIEQFYVEGE
jgi:hypothetical protein